MGVSTRRTTLALTALAPAIWGTTYIVTTEWVPAGFPLTVSLLRALPAGLLLLAIVRVLPRGIWWGRVLLLGAFNFAIFWSLLFEAAYRLPGGVAATVGAVQPLIVLMLARFWLGAPLRAMAMLAALGGVIGVSLLVLRPGAAFDAVGIAAALGSAASMAEAVRTFTDDAGADHILELVGGAHLNRSLEAVAVQGRISLIGVLDGFDFSGSSGLLITKSPVIQGINVGHRRALEDFVAEIDRIRLKPAVDTVYPLAELPAALDHLDRGAFGKIVITLV